jgi:hypothetical protein
MTAKLSVMSTLLATIVVPHANAVEYATGYVPPTPEQQASTDATAIRVTRVLPNRLALQRVAAEQKNLRLSTRATPVAPAEDGAEIIGYKGAVAPSANGQLKLEPVLMAYPRAVDNSAEPWFPPIGYQAGLNSCASFSTVYYTMTSQVARLRGWNVKTDNNPAHIFSPRFIYNLINGGGNNGTYHKTAYDYMIAIGCATYADFPYDGVDYKMWPTTPTVWREALNYRMVAHGTVAGIDTEAGLANAKQMLADGYIFNFPGAFSSYMYASFSNDPATTMDDGLFAAGLPNARRKVISYCKAGEVDHAMTIVGYNDDLWCDLNNNGVVDSGEKGALRMANSYAVGWEDRGFMWMTYDSLKTVSAVPGGYSGPRQPSVADSRLDWLSARASYTPALVAEITVTHPKRDQMILDVGRGPSSSTTPAKMGRLSGLANKGGSWSFNGTTTPVASTFVLDCTDLMASGTGNRWFATLEDNASVGSGNITSVRFIDRNGGVTVASTTNPSGGLPKSVDNTTVHAYADIDGTPTVATAAAATPSSAVGLTNATLSVLGADDGGEPALTYTWSTVGTLPGAVSFSANGSNAAKVSTVTFTQSGVYEFQCAIRDAGGRTVTSRVIVTRSSGNIMQGPTGYTWCANEGESFALSGLCDVAYGGGTQFIYSSNMSGTVMFSNATFNGDPALGVAKGGFYRLRAPSLNPVGPPGYTWCGGEGSSYTLPGLCDVAYGVGPSQFSYSMNRTGTVNFNNSTFLDPAEGVAKNGFYKLKSVNFANWSLTHGLNGGVNGDSDKDGIPNGIEYALLTNPQATDGSVATYRGNAISYTKRPGATSSHGVSYCIEVSKDLGVTDPWVAVNPSLNNETKIEAVMPQSTQKIFTRLRVVLAGATTP